MNRTLLYLHDSKDLEKTSREVEILKKRLPEYRILTLELPQKEKMIEATLRAEKPDVILDKLYPTSSDDEISGCNSHGTILCKTIMEEDGRYRYSKKFRSNFSDITKLTKKNQDNTGVSILTESVMELKPIFYQECGILCGNHCGIPCGKECGI